MTANTKQLESTVFLLEVNESTTLTKQQFTYQSLRYLRKNIHMYCRLHYPTREYECKEKPGYLLVKRTK